MRDILPLLLPGKGEEGLSHNNFRNCIYASHVIDFMLKKV